MTREHVFPRAWYPTTSEQKDQRPVVPSCLACNGRFGKLEERLLRHFACELDTAHPAAAGVWERALQGLSPSATTDERERAIRERLLRSFMDDVEITPSDAIRPFSNVSAAWLRTESGVHVHGYYTARSKKRELDAFVRKLVFGLYRYDHGARLDPRVNFSWTQIPRYDFELAVGKALTLPGSGGVRPGFLYRQGTPIEDRRMSIWYIFLWYQVGFYAETGGIGEAIAEYREKLSHTNKPQPVLADEPLPPAVEPEDEPEPQEQN